jgi:hypothetical protein
MPMFVLAAAALATMPPPSRTSATAQATATIRVMRAVELKLDGSPNPGAPPPRDSQVRSADGSSQSLKVIEFQ